MKKVIQKISALLIILSIIHQLPAADISWTGASDSNWHNPTNWSPMQVPSFDDDVEILGSVVNIIGTNIAQCKSLTMGFGVDFEIESGAKLIIQGDGSSDGIACECDLVNYGLIEITNADDGIVVYDSLHNEGDILILESGLSGMRIESGGSYVSSDGLLYISGCENGLDNDEYFMNDGILIINGVAGDAVQNSDDLINSECAKMELYGDFNCNNLNCDFKNYGTLTIHEGAVSIDFSATFRNHRFMEYLSSTSSTFISNSGYISTLIADEILVGDVVSDILTGAVVGSTFSDSLYTDSLLTNSAGAYDSSSKKWTVDSSAIGFRTFYLDTDDGTCRDTLIVQFESFVQECADTNRFWGTFSALWDLPGNWSLGHIPLACEHVTSSSEHIVIPSGVAAVAKSVQVGGFDTLTISSGASLTISKDVEGLSLSSSSSLINEGELEIYDVLGDAFFMSLNSSIINTGSISIYNVTGSVLTDFASCCIENIGRFELENIGENAIVYGGQFTNSDTLAISNVQGNALHLSAEELKTNSGLISINNSKTGMTIEGSFLNDGSIELLNISGSHALGIVDSLENSGQITIDSCSTSMAIDNGGYFENHGSISIQYSDGVGLNNDSAGGFGTFTSTNREEKSATAEGLSFYNYGDLSVSGNGDNSIENITGIYNDTCASILIDQAMICLDPFYNCGFFELTTLDTCIITDTIHNSGIINDQFNSITVYFDFDQINNSGCVFSGPLTDTFTVEESFSPVFSNCNNSISLDTHWYLNDDLTQDAGAYDQSSNTWTPSRLAVNQSQFYISAIGLNGMCLDTVLINLDYPVIAPECDSLNFVGSSSAFWSNSGNWDLKRIPDSCDVVVIPIGIDVGLTVLDTALCKLITVDSAATFTIPLGGLLIVDE